MADQWDRFQDQQRGRVQDALGFTQTLDVFQPTESFTQGEGWDITYPDSPTTTVDAEIGAPDAEGESTRGGTDVDADVIIRVPDDTAVTWREFGESGEAATRVEDVATGVRYEIETVDDEHNGLLVLQGVEV